MKKNTKAFLAGTIGAMGLLLGSSQVASANTTVKVKSGDTVWNFAKKYGVSIQSIEKLNKVSADSHLIYVNQSLEIPTDGNQAEEKTTTPAPTATGTYTVQAGDSLWTIAQKYNTTVDALAQLNGLNLNSLLHVGQSLKITGTATASATPAATQTANTQAVAQPVQTNQAATAQTANTQVATQTTASQATAQTANTQVATQTTASQATAQTANTQVATQTTASQAAAQPAQTNQAATTQTYANNGSVVSIANRYLGTPYAWGGTTPQGFDCSGFTQYVYGQAGKSIGRNTVAQESAGSQIPVSQAQPGDLLFWGSRGSSYHVAIYAGNGRYIAAPTEGQSVSYGNTAYYTPSFAVHVN
ncbi:LysM peptidoglycan-binding domain-containing protein [Ligilactobacillus saerimneri]|uniref:LysM peptidoglycan-binding domain-containing protein n=1 Tax=Ligilactobacillus saerimneri TaxID=228229 RepID=A0A7H9ELS8_9LACO|nr:C40 family peptidase [Ligilactobacillus saerimneri]QLL78441.1 LysM peptidoglycan-binding domain-containing protein [Ligilactobacillus saerimneri]